MNTPTHIIASYALLRKYARTRSEHILILVGGFLPDIVIYILFFWALTTGIPMHEVWDVLYFSDFWQDWIDCFNSIPVLLIFIVVSNLIKWRGGILLCASMLIHILGDIFLHHADAHRHFYPFSDFRFISPVSYWDPAHYGWLGSLIECSLLAGALILLWPHITSRTIRVILSIYVALSSVQLVVSLLFS